MVLPVKTGTEFGKRVEDRLNREQEIWITVVNQQGEPTPTVVWFYWTGEKVVLFTKPGAKVQSIEHNPHVALNFNCGPGGGDMIVFNGTAKVHDKSAADIIPADFFVKYESGIASLGTTPEEIVKEYRVAIEVTIDRVRGH